MSYALTLLGIMFWVIGAVAFFASPQVLQEIGAAVIMTKGAVLFAGGAVVNAINHKREEG